MCSIHVGPPHQRWVQYMLGHPIEDGFNTCWATPPRMGSTHVGPPHWRWVQYMLGHPIEDGFNTCLATPLRMGLLLFRQPITINTSLAIQSTIGFITGRPSHQRWGWINGRPPSLLWDVSRLGWPMWHGVLSTWLAGQRWGNSLKGLKISDSYMSYK